MDEYPLGRVLEIKIKRVDDQERVVKQKKEELALEQERLEQRRKERDKVKKHHADKLAQLRNEMDQATTTKKITEMKNYLKIVKEKLVVEERKVEEQKKQVALAEKNLEDAKEELRLKRIDVDKIEEHKKMWVHEAKEEERIKQEAEYDELGSVIFMSKRRKKP